MPPMPAPMMTTVGLFAVLIVFLTFLCFAPLASPLTSPLASPCATQHGVRAG
jgi:hypothetical protein